MSRSPPDDSPFSGIPYVITLATSLKPIPVLAPLLQDLESFSMFRSLAVERGRDCHRLHVGYFASEALAREALAAVIRYYPAARVDFAPRSGLSSLDDTMNTGFTVVKAASARAARRAPIVTPAADSPQRAPVETPLRLPTAPASPSLTAPAASTAVAVPPQVVAEPAPTGGLQHYAVQLDHLSAASTAKDGPKLEIFDEFHLYRIRVTREGAVQQTLRLGFFPRIESAEAVAGHIRPRYPHARVVPVSEREQGMVSHLLKKRAQLTLRSVEPVGGAPRAPAPPVAVAATATAALASARRPASPIPAEVAEDGDLHYEFDPAVLDAAKAS